MKGKKNQAVECVDSAIIFDIQRFSIHDGPGIRTTIFFKGCPLACAWCQNPESHKVAPEAAFYKEYCRMCFRCKEACPEGAILEDREHRVDYSRCKACGMCPDVCLHNAIRIIGREWTADALAHEVMKDRDFFEDSGGGVTLSGGEPMLHAAFLREFLPLVKDAGIHINIETCGQFRWEHMERIIPYLDLIYFDIKHMDGEEHRKHTGASNRVILENFMKLAAVFPGLQARMPVVPGINDEPDNIVATARFLKEQGQKTVHCLPYHSMGEAKLVRISTKLKPLGINGPTGEHMKRIQELFREQGIDALIYE